MTDHGRKSFDDIADDLAESIRMAPRRQRKLLSKTLWGLFGYKTRTRQRVEHVKHALEQRHVHVAVNEVNVELGKESKEQRVVLTWVDAPPQAAQTERQSNSPDEAWFTTMEARQFDSEQEVEYFFIAPLLFELGYVEEDFVVGHPVTIFEGGRKVTARADFVVVDGEQHDNRLVVFEAKRFGKNLDADAIGQARSYAMWLETPYYVVTNGEDIRVYMNQGPLKPNVPLLTFSRSVLRQYWPPFHELLNRSAVVELKRRLAS
jgi:hypothetical protein